MIEKPYVPTLTSTSVHLLSQMGRISPLETTVVMGLLQKDFDTIVFDSDTKTMAERYQLDAFEFSIISTLFVKLQETIDLLELDKRSRLNLI